MKSAGKQTSVRSHYALTTVTCHQSLTQYVCSQYTKRNMSYVTDSAVCTKINKKQQATACTYISHTHLTHTVVTMLVQTGLPVKKA